MAGLGEKGKRKAGLFTPTEEKSAQVLDGDEGEKKPVGRPRSKGGVNKSFVFPTDVADSLRELSFKTRRSEVSIVLGALKPLLESELGTNFE